MMPQMTYSSATSPLGRDTCKALITIFRNLCLDTFISLQTTLLSFPGGSADKESPVMQETLFRFLGWEDPLEKGWLPR